jgi:hypothetical protein
MTDTVEEPGGKHEADEQPGDVVKAYDRTDVKSALKRETDDGKGDEEPGESDFAGYATEGVEQEETA